MMNIVDTLNFAIWLTIACVCLYGLIGGVINGKRNLEK